MREHNPGAGIDTRTRSNTTFARLARTEMPRLYALARRLDHQIAEDLVQECLLRGFRSFDSLRDLEAGGGWLRVILTNVWRDHVRKDARSPGEVPIDDIEDFSLYRTLVVEDPFPYSDSLHLDFLGVLDHEDVQLVLRELPGRYRAPLVLRYVEGLPTKQIARLLDLPQGTVLSQLHRGRQLFERQIWRHAQEHGLLEDDRATSPGSPELGRRPSRKEPT